ncbi:hypothetical protein DFH94DRAFT_22781 [Russula ochroleuca]|uniref:Uncharacterized protein n=1 Tax=Russula ochroleuca TaxID=152965 RepID=A0A9P5N620_9AGAM|nr:hypothetical protein DFH94DRAFT_22781 [Russula ochroleuca]
MCSPSLDAISTYPQTSPPSTSSPPPPLQHEPVVVVSPTRSISNPSSTLFFPARPEPGHCPFILKARFSSSSFLLGLTLLHLLCLPAQPIRMHGQQTRQSHMQPLAARSQSRIRSAVRALSIFPNCKNALRRSSSRNGSTIITSQDLRLKTLGYDK